MGQELKQVRVTRRYAEIVEGIYTARLGGTTQEAIDAALWEWIERHAPRDLIQELDLEAEPLKLPAT